MLKQMLYLAAGSGMVLAARAEDLPSQQLETIVVDSGAETGSSESVAPNKVLSDEELRLKAGHSIGETLKNELGITSQSFGPGVGTPVMRGQAGARVRVLSNGVGSNDVSALSPDHASSSEALLAERIEILRGPATLLYGSGAMGGMVNVLDNRVPDHLLAQPVSTAFEQRFDSVADETASSLKLDGSRQRLAYHLDGFYRQRDNLAIGGRGIDIGKAAIIDPALQVIDNPKGVLNNTGAQAISGSAGISWIGDAGFAGAAINQLDNHYGIAPDGSGEENVRIALRQRKYDFKSQLDKPFEFANSLKTRLSYTDYQHTEIGNGQPGAFFSNQTYEGRMELAHRDFGALQGTLGLQAQSSDFKAYEKLSGDSIVPHSLIDSVGVFALETLKTGALTYQFGARIEPTAIHPDGMPSLDFMPISAALSAGWQIDSLQRINLGLTRTERAPQVQELLAHGYHDSTRSYEIGNIGLGTETGYNLDLGYRWQTDWLRAELDVFHKWAADYIYQQRSGRYVDVNGGDACGSACTIPVLLSRQADSVFQGYEAKLILPLLENRLGLLELTLFSDYTRGRLVNGGDVPRMPPLRYGLQLDYSQERLNGYLRMTHGEEQTHAGAFETTTPGYLLLDAGVHYRIKAFETGRLLLFAKANNLLNQNFRNATSYWRNFAPEPGRGAEVGLRIEY